MNPVPANLRRRESPAAGFTLTELLVVIGVIVISGGLLASAGVHGTDRAKIAQCAANLKQFDLALQIYGSENQGSLPAGESGFWPWDFPWDAGTTLTQWISFRQLYCPGTSVRFTDQDNLNLWNFEIGSLHVIGYATTIPLQGLIPTNWNTTLTPKRIAFNGSYLPAPAPAQRPLVADATISLPGQSIYSARYTYNYTSIPGGFNPPHLTAHLNGAFPAGGNVALLDGHVEWRRFDSMQCRTAGGSTPSYWW